MSTRKLFGIFQTPSTGLDRKESVIICNPFGQEAIRCHRLLRVLADRLARSGFHVMRFDYFGTGDSDGGDVEGDFETWLGDVAIADGEMRARSNCTHSSWFGLRLGASLAALASSRIANPPQRLVLWDPIIRGTEYLDELCAANIAAGKASFGARWMIEKRLRDMVEKESAIEALGFPVSSAMREQVRAISPQSFTDVRAAQITILNGGMLKYVNEIDLLLTRKGAKVRIKPVTSDIVWTTNEAMNSAIVPADIVQEIISSLTDE